MKNNSSILLLIFGLLLVYGYAQGQDCYSLYRSKGVAAYNAGNYEKAKKYFAGALDACVPSDIPVDNDINSWISKCEERLTLERKHSAEPEMVEVEGGTFTMGCTSEQGNDCESDETPVHSVTLSSFRISKYEITQAQWKAIMGNNPSRFKGDNLPVESVGWNKVQEFIKRLNSATGKNYRLPTEAEWEYAARGGNRSRGYKYSGGDNLDEVAWFLDNSDKQSHPVGAKKANELGIHDMSGNVWEWCQDWYGSYSDSSQHNPVGTSNGANRIDRGGGWRSEAVHCRVTDRDDDGPELSNINLGFRVVLP